MTTFFIQNEAWNINDVVPEKTSSFWTKKELSFDDLLMTTRKKPENKQKISLSLSCLYVYIYAEFTNEASNITVKGLDLYDLHTLNSRNTQNYASIFWFACFDRLQSSNAHCE